MQSEHYRQKAEQLDWQAECAKQPGDRAAFQRLAAAYRQLAENVSLMESRRREHF